MARNTNSTGFSLKDELFNKTKVTLLANQLAAVVPQFKPQAFITAITGDFPTLELKARLQRITDELEVYLDPDFTTACQQIIAALPEPLDPTNVDDDFGDFIYAPYGEYVARHGATKQHYKIALATLKEITQRFSMEDAIRTYINSFPSKTFATLENWATDPNYHVRRLVSEGTRPLLPWSSRLQTPIKQPVPLLTKLHADPTRYVTRSVANHLNDISKSDPKLVLTTLKEWRKHKLQKPAELRWLERHALRTLVKQGNSAALQFLGYRTKPAITIDTVSHQPSRIAVGEAITFSCTLTALRDESLMVDYIIDFVKANGSTAPKVFKLKQLTLAAGESITLTKRHPIKTNSTTFTYYPGRHTVTLQINGTKHNSFSFELT